MTLTRTIMSFSILFALGVFVVLGGSPHGWAQSANPIIIRDTEIENMLREWTSPVIRAAGLSPDGVHFVLVQDDNINAFVAGGPNIFIYTGLIEKTKDPSELIGVIAHELGHIQGGHLVRLRGAVEDASYESMLGAVLGIGAAILTGQGSAATVVSSGASSLAQRSLLSFSRVQESSADQAALNNLEHAGLNPSGLLSFMHELESQELLPSDQQTEYVRTHPLTRDRIEAIQAGIDRSSRAHDTTSAAKIEQHKRMLAKLKGFINPERVTWDYGDRDQSVPARYARTIAAYRQNHVQEALAGIDMLITIEPNNAYFHELKGQMLVDFGRVAQAVPEHKKAVEIDPKGGLLRIAYAHALIESASDSEKEKLQEAITQIDRALKDEPKSIRAYRLLATAYGRLGNDPMARLNLAEEALLKGEKDYAKSQANAAMKGLQKNSASWLRARDIVVYTDVRKDDNKGDDRD